MRLLSLSLLISFATLLPLSGADRIMTAEEIRGLLRRSGGSEEKKESSQRTITDLMQEKPADVIYLADENGLTELERKQAAVKTKGGAGAVASGFITGGLYSSKVKITAVVEGANSPVRVAVSRPKFVVKIMPGSDAKKFELIPLQTKKDKRETVLESFGGVLMMQSEGGYPIVQLNFFPNKKDPSVILISPASNLVNGEYAFAFLKSSKEVFCFGVDSLENIDKKYQAK